MIEKKWKIVGLGALLVALFMVNKPTLPTSGSLVNDGIATVSALPMEVKYILGGIIVLIAFVGFITK